MNGETPAAGVTDPDAVGGKSWYVGSVSGSHVPQLQSSAGSSEEAGVSSQQIVSELDDSDDINIRN